MKRNVKSLGKFDWQGVAEDFNSLSRPEKGELTVDEFMKLAGAKSRTAAARYLDKLIDDEKATRRPAIINGKSGWFYKLK